MAKTSSVTRPTKKSEYLIEFGSNQAGKGWTDLLATKRNALVDAWDQLTRDPLAENPQIHSLKGSLATITRGGVEHKQRQYEMPNGARIWFYVIEGNPGTVILDDIYTAHPNQTK